MIKATLCEPGVPATADIPLCVPEIRGNEWNYVRDCLTTGWVSSVGSYVAEFETSVARVAGKQFAVATVSGTAALHVALLCSGVEPGDAVIVSDLTFIAPANAIRYAGAFPIFIDAELDHWQIDPVAIQRFCERECTFLKGELRERATGRRVRAILPVSVLGHPVDLEPIRRTADHYGLRLIEDATESLATEYRGRPAGAGADVSCFSFNGNKLVTTGGGGMLCTNDQAIADRAKYLTTQAKDDPIEYVHGTVGYNYRLTNLQAAMGVAQLESLAAYVEAKRAHAVRYTSLLADVPGITTPSEAQYARSSFWLYTVLINEKLFGCSSRALLDNLRANGIQTRPLWQPMHQSVAHRGATAYGGAVAEQLYRTALSLPSSVGLTDDQLDAVAAAVHAARK